MSHPPPKQVPQAEQFLPANTDQPLSEDPPDTMSHGGEPEGLGEWLAHLGGVEVLQWLGDHAVQALAALLGPR